MRCWGSRGFPKGALGIAKLSDAALNTSFTEAVQRDNKHVGSQLSSGWGNYEKHSDG